jgi:hypothetical protein
MLLRRIAQGVLLIGLIVCGATAFAGDMIQELDSGIRGRDHTPAGGLVADRLLCVDGLKVFQTWVAYSGAGVSNIQLYEVRNGKVVPATCTNAKSSEKK